MKASHHHRGFMALDMLSGIVIVTTVSVALLSTLGRERKTESALADSRSALHLAEHALLNLQHGQPLPGISTDVRLSVHPATGGTAPAGFIWAKVDATVHGHNRSLLGIVPVGSLPSPEAKS